VLARHERPCRWAAQEAAHEEVMDKVQDAKEELKEAVEELQEEVQEAKDTADAVELETKGGILDVAEVQAADGGDSDDSIASATGTAADANAMDETTGAVDETAAPAEEDPPAGADADVAADPSLSPELPSGVLAADVAESKHRRLLAAPAFSRRLLRNKGPHPETPKQPEYPEQPDPTPAVRTPAVRVPRQRSAGPTHNPLLLTKGDAEVGGVRLRGAAAVKNMYAFSPPTPRVCGATSSTVYCRTLLDHSRMTHV